MEVASAIARVVSFELPRMRGAWMALSPTAADVELVDAIRHGQGDSVTCLVERYSPRLYRYLVRLLDDPALAEDILQETWMRAMERLEQYDRRQPFVAWLFAIGRHRAIDALRQRARLARSLGRPVEPREMPEGERLDPLEQLPAEGPSPLDELSENELERRLAHALSNLPRHYREALTLRFQEELSLEEVARLLGLPLSTVKTRIQRGLVLLRQRAEGLGLTPYE